MNKYIQLILLGGSIFLSTYCYAKPQILEGSEKYMSFALENPQLMNEYDSRTEKTTIFMNLVANVKIPEVIEHAIEKGANVDAHDKNGNIPLNYLVSMNINAIEALDTLLKYTKDIDNKGTGGKTPLMMAITSNQGEEFIKHIIRAKPNINLVSNNNTAISLAAELGRTDIIALLLENGAKPGPKALKQIKKIDSLDKAIKEIDEDFDFNGKTYEYKQRFLDYFKTRNATILDGITYNNSDENSSNMITIHGKDINNYIETESKSKSTFNVNDGDKKHHFDENIFWESDILYGYFIAEGKRLPILNSQYIGQFEDKIGTKQVPDDNCIKALNHSEEIHRNSEIGNCIGRLQQSTSPLYYGELVESCQKVAIAEMYEYPIRKQNIIDNCKTVPKKYSYTEFNNGVILYSHNNHPIGLVNVKDGNIVVPVSSVPYSKIKKEIVKKYGYPNATEIRDNIHYYYFPLNDSGWKPIIMVYLLKDTKIHQPIGITTYFVHKNTWDIMKKIIKAEGNDEIKQKQEDERRYWKKIKQKYEEKINTFSL